MRDSRFRLAALAAVLSAAAVLLCFSDVFFGPYLWERFRPNPPVGWVLAFAATAAILAAFIAVV